MRAENSASTPVRRRPAGDVVPGHVDEVLALADRRAELIERFAEFGHDAPDHALQLLQLRVAAVDRGQPVELEPDVREGLRDVVVQVTRDAGPFGLGTERAQPGEPARVVDRQRERRRQPGDQARVLFGVRVGVAVLDRDEADDAVVRSQRSGEDALGLGAARGAGAGREVADPDDPVGGERRGRASGAARRAAGSRGMRTPSASSTCQLSEVSSGTMTTATVESTSSRKVCCAEETTSLRSSEDGSVWTTSCSACSRSLAMDMRVTWSSVACCRRSASNQSWRVNPPTSAASSTTTDAMMPVRSASSVTPESVSASAIVAPVSAAAARPSR